MTPPAHNEYTGDSKTNKPMKRKSLIYTLVAVAVTTMAMTSCKTVENNLTYFQDLDAGDKLPDITLNADQYMSVVEPDDELLITVTARDNRVSAQYNLPAINPAKASSFGNSGQIQNQTYIVNTNGDIDFPVLGMVHVAGLTTEQIKDKLTSMISRDIVDPMVTVRLVNFTVNISGEVNNPGKYTVERERVTLLDALSMAGDLTPYGERTNVLLVREQDGKRTAHRLDLTSADLLSSPYFYVKQNDYIYVEPNGIRRDNSRYNQNNAYKLSVISTIVSGCSVVASLVIALAIK